MSHAIFLEEFGHPARLDAGIWPNIRTTTEADRARDLARWRDDHKAHALRAVYRLPRSFQEHIAAGWDARYGLPGKRGNGSPVARGNEFVREAARDFGDARAGHAYDEAAIRDHAENYADMCAKMSTLERRLQFAAWFGVQPPAGVLITPEGVLLFSGNVTRESASARLDCPMWWRRQLRKVWTRRAEDAMRRAGVIRKGRAAYASDEAVRHRVNRKRRTREWLESRVMVSNEGEQLELLKLHDKSLANPALRRGEFMCRMRGFEEIAKDLGHVALFFTLTAPSKFHAQLAAGGINPAYQRETVRDAQAWLRKMWARARAKLARLSIQFYGFRVAEPHHDGTPHWHMVLFVAPHHADTLTRIIRGMWLSEFAEETGADQHRCKCITIDPEQGSATGYVAKYVSKNIDGAGAVGEEISDETGARVADSVERVAAWASCHGIRQFQQIGGPPVGLWRECRRAREPVGAEVLERARAQADRGNWRGFIESLGGLERARRRVKSIRETYSRQVTPPMIRVRRLASRQWSDKHGPRAAWTYRQATTSEMPAAWVDKMHPRTEDAAGREVLAETRYRDAVGHRPAGVVAVGLLGRWACLETRQHRWRIEKRIPKGGGLSYEGAAEGPATEETGTDRPAAPVFGSEREGRGCSSHNPCGVSAVLALRGVPGSFSESDLGPVAITVRETLIRGSPQYEWVATAPFRPPASGHSRG